MKRHSDYTKQAKLICSKCGAPMFIARRFGKAEGHIKHMYCYKCKRIQAFVECNRYGLPPDQKWFVPLNIG